MSSLDEARRNLRERQGDGARYDADHAPHAALHLARLGTGYFARILNALSDEALYEPSAVAGRSRAEIMADIAYHARALCRQLEAVAAGDLPQAMYPSDAARLEEIELAGTLPPHALRYLFQHASIHLDVVWRDLSDEDWRREAPGIDTQPRALFDTPDEHAAMLWHGVIDLRAGARRRDLPAAIKDNIETFSRFAAQPRKMKPFQ